VSVGTDTDVAGQAGVGPEVLRVRIVRPVDERRPHPAVLGCAAVEGVRSTQDAGGDLRATAVAGGLVEHAGDDVDGASGGVAVRHGGAHRRDPAVHPGLVAEPLRSGVRQLAVAGVPACPLAVAGLLAAGRRVTGGGEDGAEVGAARGRPASRAARSRRCRVVGNRRPRTSPNRVDLGVETLRERDRAAVSETAAVEGLGHPAPERIERRPEEDGRDGHAVTGW
jgi:hypothetical protein